MNNKKLLGLRIKEIRKTKGLTQEKLAEIIGIETGSLSAIESGRHFPSLITLEKMAIYFDVDLNLFFDFSEYFKEEELVKIINQNILKMNKQHIYYLYKLTEFYKDNT